MWVATTLADFSVLIYTNTMDTGNIFRGDLKAERGLHWKSGSWAELSWVVVSLGITLGACRALILTGIGGTPMGGCKFKPARGHPGAMN